MYGHDLTAYQERVSAFGWRCVMVEDGHDHQQVMQAWDEVESVDEDHGKPIMVIARTIKGKGIASLEDEPGHHGKPVDEDEFDSILADLGESDESVLGHFREPIVYQANPRRSGHAEPCDYQIGDEVATRDAYGNALCRLARKYPRLVALDGEVCNSTRSKRFRDEFPDRFFEMFIAEQNMVGAAIGMALRGELPFVSTFAAFLTRAFDQIRMAPYSNANVKFVGSHSGVSIGQDGPSQMGLEDIALFRTIQDGVVMYPCDAVSAEAIVDLLADHRGIGYLRTTRGKTPVLYANDESFSIGGSKTLKQSENDDATVIAAGITVHEALAAAQELHSKGISVRVIDLYSIKPLDHATIRQAADQTSVVFTVEDHFPEGGIGEAVLTSLSDHPTPVNCLAVRKRPISGSSQDLLDFEGISAGSIVEAVTRWLDRADNQ